MGLFKRGKVWWMSFSYRGQRIRRSTEVTDKRLAQDIYAKVRTQVVEGKWFDRLEGEDKTFREVIDKYLNDYSFHHKGKETYTLDKRIAKTLKGFLGDKYLASITPHMIEDYQNKRRVDGIKPSTINRELALLSHVFTLAIKWDWLRDNPMRKVSKPKVRNQRVKYLSDDQFTSLYNSCYHWLKPIVVIARETGLRLSNIRNLKWEQVNLFARTITIDVTKNGDAITVPLTDMAFQVLKDVSKVRRIDTSLVFFTKNGRVYDRAWVSNKFRECSLKAGIKDFRFHDLRHDFCSRLVQRGIDLYTVAKLVGHRDIKQTQRYAHLSPEKLKGAISVLNEDCHNYVTVKHGVKVN